MSWFPWKAGDCGSQVPSGSRPRGSCSCKGLQSTRPGPHPADVETPSEIHSSEGSGAATLPERAEGERGNQERPPETAPEPHGRSEPAEVVSQGQLSWTRARGAQVTGDSRPHRPLTPVPGAARGRFTTMRPSAASDNKQWNSSHLGPFFQLLTSEFLKIRIK